MQVLDADDTGMQEAVKVLQAGGIVAHATETCYGLACDLQNKQAVQKLFAVKQRAASKSVSGLFESIEASKQYVEWNDAAEEFAVGKLPGPYTLVLPLKKELYPTPNGGNTIGVRVSSHQVAQQLVAAFGSPISTTSANMASNPSAYSVQDMIDQSLEADIALDSGQIATNPSSTVIDFSDGGQKVLR